MAIEHVEIGVQEVETAKTFYGDLCGWTFQDYGERYSSFSHGAGHGDLNRAAQDPADTCCPFSMRTTLKRPLIGCVSAELAVPARPSTFREGRRFQFLDPNGNEIAIWSDDA